MSMSNRNVSASSPHSSIRRCSSDDSVDRVAWSTTDASAKSTQTHFVRSYHSLIALLPDLVRPSNIPYSSSSSKAIGPSLLPDTTNSVSSFAKVGNNTHGAAPNALFCVSFRIAENVFVMTATKRLISQKFRTIRHTIKKKQDTKNSASIMLYIMGDHFKYRQV